MPPDGVKHHHSFNHFNISAESYQMGSSLERRKAVLAQSLISSIDLMRFFSIFPYPDLGISSHT